MQEQETPENTVVEPTNQEQQEFVGPEQVPAEAATEEAAPIETAPVETAPVESDGDRNFRILREKNDLLQRERDEAYRVMQQQYQQQKPPAPKQEENNLAPDDLVEWKYVQSEIKKVKDELNEYKHKTSQETAESRLQSKYPDLYDVVTTENIERLRNEYPELAATVNSNKDPYTQAAAAYTLIKKFNIAPDKQYAPHRGKVQNNMEKPRPVSSVSPQQGDSPLSKANAFADGLTPELKSTLWEEMRAAKKRM